MAANTIEYLKHGKALCGKVFAAFVETFNWHNDFCKNLKGDADLPGKAGATGRITVDRTDPANPIIRLESTNASNGEDPEEKEEPEEPEDPPYVPPSDEPENPDEDDDDETPDEEYDPDEDQDPWYDDPEDSPVPSEGGGGCNEWSDDARSGGDPRSDGWTGDNCGSINNFNR